jgi:hypothetical protein
VHVEERHRAVTADAGRVEDAIAGCDADRRARPSSALYS